MRRNRSSCARRAAGAFGLLCAGVLSACLNPIPDDFPNGDDRQVEEDRGAAPTPAVPGNAGGVGVTPGAPSGSAGGEPQPGEPQAVDDESESAGAAPDAGVDASDAGASGGTGGGD